MRRRLVTLSALAAAGIAAIAITFAAAGGFHHQQAAAAAGATCLTKNCPKNTHCCYGCTASPICVRNGVPCPECAPQ